MMLNLFTNKGDIIQDINILDINIYQNTEFQRFPNNSEESDIKFNKSFKITSDNKSVHLINKTSNNKKPKINNI